MIRIKPILLLYGLFTLWSCSPERSETTSIFQKLDYIQPEGFQDSLLTGTYEVFADRLKNEGRKIPLKIYVTPALDRKNIREPIFIIDGGPGVASSNQAYFYTEEDTLYRKYHDIVFIDARGTGESQPLHCLKIQTKDELSDYFRETYPVEELAHCISQYEDTLDFNHYNTEYIIKDLDEVRTWLGYDKINLLGISYGGKAAIIYQKLFPESLNRVVLHSPSAPGINNHLLRGNWAQETMDRLFDRCLADSSCQGKYPNIREEFETLQARIKAGNAMIELETESELVLPWPPIAKKLFGMLYHDSDYLRIPHILHQAFLENYKPLIEEFNISQDPSLFFADGMFLSVICSEEIGLPIKTSLNPKSFLGSSIFEERKKACEYWPVSDISSTMQEDFKSSVPTLILNGMFDPVTPAQNGRMLLRQLENGRQVIIPHMGHMFAELTGIVECYDTYIVAFFENRENEVDIQCFNKMASGPFL